MAPLVTRSLQQACLECRLHKIKCQRLDGSDSCQRCQRYHFDCRFESKKRGRKPRSSVQSTISQRATTSTGPLRDPHSLQSTDHRWIVSASLAAQAKHQSQDGSLPSVLADGTTRRRVWKLLTETQASRGSHYTFLGSGDAGLSVNASSHLNSSGTVSLRRTVVAPPSLRRLLQRLDHLPANVQESDHQTSSLPRTLHLDAPRQPVLLGLVSQDRADRLVSYFRTHCAPWLAIEPDLARNAGDALVFTGMLCNASRFLSDDRDETTRLFAHAQTLAACAFLEGEGSLATVLGFHLLSIWKAPDDQTSELHVGFTERQVAMHLSNLPHQTSIEAHQSQRILYFHYVQERVFALHYTRSPINQEDSVHSMASTMAWIKDVLNGPSFPGDWVLCADVTSTSIQCRYKSLLLEQRKLHRHSSVYLHPILESFAEEMGEWERQWLAFADLDDGLATTQPDLQAIKAILSRRKAFAIFGKSVSSQTTSIILREALRDWLSLRSGSDLITESSPSLKLLHRSYDTCLDATIGLVGEFACRESNGSDDDALEVLLHMPDSLIILVCHAALLALYLILLPVAIIEAQPVADKVTLISRLQSLSELSAAECLHKIKVSAQALERATRRRPQRCSAASLCASYLNSLIELVELQAPLEAPSTGQNADGDDENLVDWNWLQGFLDFSAGPLFP